LNKIAPDLLEVLQRRERAHADAVARDDHATTAMVDAPIEVCVAFDGPPDSLVKSGIPIGGLIADSARGGLSPALIRKLAMLPQVHRIGLPVKLRPKLDRSVPEILGKDAWAEGVPPDTEPRGKGEGVIVGIIDTGIDVFHGAFRNLDGSSRILRLWDQTFAYDPGTGVPVDEHGTAITGDMQPKDETGAVLTSARAPTDMRVPSDSPGRPTLFTNGAQFSTAQINAALTAHPDGKDLPVSLRDDPVSGASGNVYHGTHVAGIAAGNGAQNDKCTSAFTYVGVAPKAQLVIVKVGVGGTPNRIANIFEAAEYIFRVAARENPPHGRPCVINISADTHFGPHNGQSEQSRNFDTLVTGPLGIGRAIVLAAGNERGLNLHAAFAIPKGTTKTVRINLIAKGTKHIALFASHNTGASITCIVRAPGTAPAPQTVPLLTNTSNNTQKPVGALSHLAVGSVFTTTGGDPDSHFTIVITDAGVLTTGVWEVDIAVAGAGADANLHLWVGDPGGFNIAILPFAGAVASPQDAGRDDAAMRRPEDWIGATIGCYASTRSVIAVASYNAEANPTALAESSSQGPAPNNLSLGLYTRSPIGAYDKPDIAAPGVAIDAPRGEARKCCLECNCCVDRYVSEKGTSMAAPHIAGVIALMYARNPALTPDEIKTILRNTHRSPPALPPNWPSPADLWGAGKVDAKAAVHALVPRVMLPEDELAHEPVLEPEPRMLPVGWPERLRAWSGVLDPHPSWNLCAALVSQHFDEVKRLIETNRRVAAVWQRHGGPALVRGIAFADRPPDPPIPATLAAGEPRALLSRLLRVLLRFGGDELRADIVRHASLVQELPGASWDELDRMIGGRA
jgi:subtilisin family serine protease